MHERTIKCGSHLYHAGDSAASLYVVHTGFLKASVTHDSGLAQITGFFMSGDLIGLDAVGTAIHRCDAAALEDSTVCSMRFADLERLMRTAPGLLRHFHREMSTEIDRAYQLMLTIGQMNATQRTAIFLLEKSKRFAANGYSRNCFRLPMMRQEIASYTGLTVETVCRTFSALQRKGIISINGKEVKLLNFYELERAARCSYGIAAESHRPPLRLESTSSFNRQPTVSKSTN